MLRPRTLLFFVLSLGSSSALANPTTEQMVTMLKKIDYALVCPADFKSTIIMKQTTADGTEKVWQVIRYRRDADDALVLIASKPHTEAGKGFLRTNKNLWFYDPATGKWERRGEDRSMFARTSRRRDFDQWHLADEYDPAFVAQEKIGDVVTDHLHLTVKKTISGDTDFPVWEVWLVPATGLPAKIDQYGESGKLMRSLFYPKWTKIKHPGGKDLFQPLEFRVFDQIDKGTRLVVLTQDLSFAPVEANTFTKAWFEAHAR